MNVKHEKVLHLTDAFYPAIGIGILLRNYQKAFDDGVLTVVTVWSGARSLNEEWSAAVSGIRVISLEERAVMVNFDGKISCSDEVDLYSAELLKVIMEERPDCLHIHHPELMALFDRIRGHLTGIRIFCTCHSRPDKVYGVGHNGCERMVSGLIRENGMRMIALSDDMRRELNARFGISDTVEVPNGVNLKRFRHPAHDKASMRESLGIPQNAHVIGHVGYLTPVKNHPFLLRVFLEAVSRSDNAFLLLVGDGGYRTVIASRMDALGLSDRYLCTGNRNDVPELMAAMDVFAMPSLYEGFPLALIEAQAAGLPCVKADTITNETMLTDRIVSLSLDEPASEWSEYLLHPEFIVNDGPSGRNIEDYDIGNSVRLLKLLYRGEI